MLGVPIAMCYFHWFTDRIEPTSRTKAAATIHTRLHLRRYLCELKTQLEFMEGVLHSISSGRQLGPLQSRSLSMIRRFLSDSRSWVFYQGPRILVAIFHNLTDAGVQQKTLPESQWFVVDRKHQEVGCHHSPFSYGFLGFQMSHDDICGAVFPTWNTNSGVLTYSDWTGRD
jgi:hypothetical protein